jgi:hypothetical protein
LNLCYNLMRELMGELNRFLIYSVLVNKFRIIPFNINIFQSEIFAQTLIHFLNLCEN